MNHLASLSRSPFFKLWALVPFLAMGSLSLRAEALPADTRLRQLEIERSQHDARPLPANVSLADVIGNDFDAFHNENDTHKEGTHAFFLQLGDKTAVALGFEKRSDSTGPTEIRYKGQLVKLGPLLRSPPNAERSLMWVWEAELPPGAVPLVREKLALPLILWEDEMTVLTAEGPKEAVLTDRYFRGPYLPGHAVDGGSSLELEDGDAYNAIRIGDPVIQKRTGIVVAAVRNKIPASKSINSPADCGIVWLSFPRPPEELTAPLVDVWGAAVPPHPSLDEAIVRRFMPARVFGTKIGEKIEDAWERNPLLYRLPPEAKDRWPSVDEFGEEWVFSQQSIDSEEGRVASIHYGGGDSLGSKTTMEYIQWLAEKFQDPKVLLKTPKGNELLAIWNREPIWIAVGFDWSDKTITTSLFVAGKEAQIKERYRLERFSVTTAADKSTFVSLATALASQAQKDDFGVTKHLVLSNPVVMASSGQTVMKRNGQDIQQEPPAKPVTAPKTEEPPQHTLAPPPSSRMKEEIRSQAVQRIETLGRVVQAYNAMPANLREAARVQSVTGAFGLLRTHTERYPDLPLNDALRDTMEWALVFLDTGNLQGSPALQKLAQVINAEIALEKAQHTAQEAATAFAAAKKAGSKELNKLKTVEDILQRLNAGVKGTGTSKTKVFTVKSTPEQAAQIVPHLRYDAIHQTLRYIPKSVKLEGSDVPLEGIEALAQLIKQTPEAPPASSIAGGTSQTPDDEVKQAALALCWVFNTATASGMTELDDVKTVDDIIQRFKKGVQSGSQTHFLKSTLELAQTAKPYVQLDLKKKLLLLSPAGLNAIPEGPMARQASPSLNYPGSPAEAERIAFNLATAFGLATGTGSKELDNVKTVDAVIQRLHFGVNGGGDFAKTRFYVRTTPSQAAAAKPFLKFDPGNKSLFYQPGSMDAKFHFPKPPPRSEAQTPPLASGSSDAKAQSTARRLVAIYSIAESTGSKDIDQLQTLDAVIDRLTTTGLIGGHGPLKGQRIYTKTKPGEAEAAKPYLRYDSFTKTLSYSATPIGGSRGSSPALSANETRPTVMNVGRAVGGGVTFGGRTFANVAEMEKAIRESQAAAKQALHTRNAQALVMIYNAARSSGSQALDNVGTVDQAIRLIVAGVKGGGIYKERTFLMPATPDQVAGAKPYIEFDSRRRALVYKSPYR